MRPSTATPEPMPAWQRMYLTACSAVVGFSLLYVICDYAEWPRLTYFPYERSWQFVVLAPSPVPMNYVGTIVWGLAGAVVTAALCSVATRWWARPVSAQWLRLAGAWALAAFFYSGLYFTWNLWPF